MSEDNDKKTPPNEGQGAGQDSGEDLARWFFQTSRDLFFVADPTGRLKQVNPAWTEVTGWTTAELLGRTPLHLTHAEDRPAFVAMAEQLAETGEAVGIARLKTKDGRWLWFDGRSRLTDQGETVGTMRDITAERSREQELAGARRNQAMLSEAAGIGTWSYEPKGDRITWSNDILSLFGWSAEDVGDTEAFLSKLERSEVETVRDAFTQGVQTGIGNTLQHRLMTRDGRWLTMRATFRTEKRGRVFALKGISQDVTEIVATRDAAIRGQERVKLLVEQATANSRRLHLALNAAEAGAFEIDHEAQSFWASEQFTHIIGREVSYDQAANAVWPLAHPDDQAQITESMARWAGGDASSSAEFRVLHPDGPRWVRIYYALDKASRRGVGLVMDVDARKRQELALVEAEQAAQAAGEAKARFLANMSHELRTPMNGVLGVLHLLEREPLSEDGRDLLSEALGCGQMLTALLDDVIDFSRIEAGKLDIASEAVNVTALVQGVVRLLAPQARDKGIALRVTGAEDLGWALTDPVRLRQSLFNLIGNAVKFTLDGHVAVHCRRSGEDMVNFEIEDTGVGIPLEAQASLFQRFHQADASTTRQFGGSGLGLAIASRLSEMMGGGIAFTSAPGEGSTFRLAVRAPATAAVDTAALPLETMLGGLKLLVVEDNATNRMIAVRLLESLGAEAATAPDGLSGVEAAATGLYDLILMDIQMPGVDGLEATRRIRALPGHAAQIPIIALTANAMSHQRRSYLAAGMDGVVSKPISPSALLAEIVRIAEAANEALAEGGACDSALSA
jgi:PAS domain S-box-containing protein